MEQNFKWSDKCFVLCYLQTQAAFVTCILTSKNYMSEKDKLSFALSRGKGERFNICDIGRLGKIMLILLQSHMWINTIWVWLHAQKWTENAWIGHFYDTSIICEYIFWISVFFHCFTGVTKSLYNDDPLPLSPS